jgi:[ribosomal protein S5]-alanine N-acetyltransferase
MADYPPLETERLILLPLSMDDEPAIQRVFPQWEIVRHLNARVPWPYPDDGAEIFLRDLMPQIEAGTHWCWTIRPKAEPDQLIGLIELRDEERENRGFWLDPAFHGQGLMSEASAAVTDYWFDVLGRPVLAMSKAAENGASRAISVRQGMRMVGTFEKDYVSGRFLSEIWEITAEEWRARQR